MGACAANLDNQDVLNLDEEEATCGVVSIVVENEEVKLRVNHLWEVVVVVA